MPREFDRARRVAELVQRELARLLTSEAHDPRIKFVTVTGVDMSKDLKHAKVYVTRLKKQDSPAEQQRLLKALQHASGFLRHELSNDLNLRISPSIRFYYDTSIERGNAMDALIDKAVHSGTRTQSGD